ncbi:MAG TPA: glycosyltransferase [Polyangiaceae bacterium]
MERPRRTEAEQRAFFDAAHDCATRAVTTVGGIAHSYQVWEKRLRLIFAGPRLVPHLTTALAHLAVSDSEQADATLIIWDSESTGVSMANPPCAKRDFTDRGDIWGFNSRRYRAAFHWIESSVNVFDREAARGAYWVESERLLPYWVKASPLRSLLHFWTELYGWHLIHGAAVGTSDGALLIAGKGGVGKSTTALVSLTRGLDYVADDYLIVRVDPEPAVHSLYSTAKLTAEQLARMPQLFPHVMNRNALDKEKAVVVLGARFADRLKLTLPLAALATPVIERRQDTVFVPADRARLQRETVFTTLEQLPYAGDHAHAFVDRLVARVPCYEIKLGRDLALIPGAIRTFLQDRPWSAEPAASNGAQPRTLPLVSVIIPAHNGARFIAEAVGNVLSQNYPALQIIVVNDGSTDDTDVVVGRLPVEVRYIKHDRAKGPSEARNRGIRDAAGEYLAFLDVDDLWPPDNLHRLMAHLLEHPEVDVVHGYGHLLELNPESARYEFQGNPREAFTFYIGAGVYRRRVFDAVGLFDSKLEFGEDTDWYNRAYEADRRVERLEEVTLHVRRHDGNMTRGKSLVELNMLRVFKMALDRKRARERAEQSNGEAAGPHQPT